MYCNRVTTELCKAPQNHESSCHVIGNCHEEIKLLVHLVLSLHDGVPSNQQQPGDLDFRLASISYGLAASLLATHGRFWHNSSVTA